MFVHINHESVWQFSILGAVASCFGVEVWGWNGLKVDEAFEDGGFDWQGSLVGVFATTHHCLAWKHRITIRPLIFDIGQWRPIDKTGLRKIGLKFLITGDLPVRHPHTFVCRGDLWNVSFKVDDWPLWHCWCWRCVCFLVPTEPFSGYINTTRFGDLMVMTPINKIGLIGWLLKRVGGLMYK